jgi:hypothetical protein
MGVALPFWSLQRSLFSLLPTSYRLNNSERTNASSRSDAQDDLSSIHLSLPCESPAGHPEYEIFADIIAIVNPDEGG